MENILSGGPAYPNISDGFNFGEVLLQKLKDYGDKDLLVDVQTGETLTSAQIRSRSINLAKCLLEIGIQENDVIAFCSENRLEYLIAIVSTLLLGASVSQFNHEFKEDELKHLINLSKPKLIFVSNICVEKMDNISSKYSFIEKIVNFDKQSELKHVTTYCDFINSRSITSNDDDFICKRFNMKTNIAHIVFTSGTTGLPKGILIPQSNILETGSRPLYHLKYDTTTITLSVIPWYHSGGMTMLISTIICGIKLLSLTKFEGISYLQAIHQYKPDMLLAFATIVLFLAKSPLVDNYNLSSIKYIISGAAPIKCNTIQTFQNRLLEVQCLQLYGISEMTFGSMMQDNDHYTVGSSGRLRPGLLAKIVDPISKLALGVNKKGELYMKGNLLMKGYIGNTSDSKAVDEDGWFHTGDLAYYTENEEFFIVDRMRDLIKFKTFIVSPTEITDIILAHPSVVDAAVIGMPDKENGEVAFGFVVKRNGSDVTENDLIEFVASKVPYSDRLHGGIRFIDAIPKIAYAKILHKDLRDLLQSHSI